jgi:transposase InsO family protein
MNLLQPIDFKLLFSTKPSAVSCTVRSGLSGGALGRMPRYSLSKATVLKWRKRTDVEDRSHRPHTLHTTLSSTQEFLVCELRRTLLLPQMPDETSRSYLFVAIDRATRWVFAKVYPDQTEQSSVDFLARLQAACPFMIKIILTDNGTQFTDRFTSKNKVPSEQHAFDLACSKAQIEHRLIPPRHPQTNGMVERFNGRISEVLQQTRFASAAELEQTLNEYVKVYNHHIPQRNLGHISPVQALKNWQQKRPELFKKKVYNHTGLDIVCNSLCLSPASRYSEGWEAWLDFFANSPATAWGHVNRPFKT